MADDNLEQKLEPVDSPTTEGDGDIAVEEADSRGGDLAAEAADAKRDWTEREKGKATELKLGKRNSGITDEFGALVVSDAGALSLPQEPPAFADAPPKASSAGADSQPVSSYKGEGINRDVQPLSLRPNPGDTTEKLAKNHLGPTASREEIQKYIKEIEQLNGLKKGEKPPEGQLLKLPGHTSDGGFITTSENGLFRFTDWPDGRHKSENTVTGKWIVKKTDRYGEQEEHGGSKRPEENFVIIKQPNGRWRLADRLDEPPNMDRPLSLLDIDNRPFGSQQVMELAEQKIKDPEQLAQFRADMLRYEKSLEGKDLGALEGKAIYDQIRRILEHKGGPTTEEDRIVLAQQVMRQVATPSCIDQGDHRTCNVATVESRTYRRNPVEAARLVADVATTGKYKASDGTEVTISPGSLKPDNQAGVNPPPDGARSYASQIFQITAANIAWQKQNEASNPPKKVTYEQYRPGETDATGKVVLTYPEDTGERLIDYSKSPPQEVFGEDGLPARAPNLRADQIVDVSNAITGEPRWEHVLFNHEKNLIGDGRGVTVIKSEEEFQKKLVEAVEKGQLPVLVTVDTTCEPFWTDSGGGTAGGSGGTHLVTITGYEAGPPARLAVDGQWGAANDHTGNRSVSVHDLYLSMRNPTASPEVVPELRKEVENRRANNTVDTIKEFELLRLETTQKVGEKQAPTADYDKELGRLMVEFEKKSKGGVDPVEQERTRRAFIGMLKRLPAERQDKVIDQLQSETSLDKDFSKQIALLQARRRYALLLR